MLTFLGVTQWDLLPSLMEIIILGMFTQASSIGLAPTVAILKWFNHLIAQGMLGDLHSRGVVVVVFSSKANQERLMWGPTIVL